MQDNTENKVKRLVTTFGKIVQKHRKEQNKTIYKISAEIAMPKASCFVHEVKAKMSEA